MLDWIYLCFVYSTAFTFSSNQISTSAFCTHNWICYRWNASREIKKNTTSISILKHNNKPENFEIFSALIAAALCWTSHGKCFRWIFHRRCDNHDTAAFYLSHQILYDEHFKWENNLEAANKMKTFYIFNVNYSSCFTSMLDFIAYDPKVLAVAYMLRVFIVVRVCESARCSHLIQKAINTGSKAQRKQITRRTLDCQLSFKINTISVYNVFESTCDTNTF